MIQDQTRNIIRQVALRLKDDAEAAKRSLCEDALGYFERTSDRDLLTKFYKQRYAQGKKFERDAQGTANDNTGYSGWWTYVKGKEAIGLDNNQYEIITSGIGQKVGTVLANLTNQPTQSYEYLTESGKPDTSTAEIINGYRERGDYAMGVAGADYLASIIESGPMMITMAGETFRYRPFSPGAIYCMFRDTVTENGKPRSIDPLDIEDASVVVIELQAPGNNETDKRHFIAFFGRQDGLEYGRQVEYTANYWYDWPDDFGDGDFYLDAKKTIPANPLSWSAEKTKGKFGSEYPIVIFRGGWIKTSNQVAPITDSLYKNCRELDLSYSRLLYCAHESARGINAIQNPDGEALPNASSGNIELNGAQTIQILGQPASNTLGALEVVAQIKETVVSGHNVPLYQIMPLTSPESGVALFIKTQPLINFRESRIKLNRKQVEKIYDIERGLLLVHQNKMVGENTKIVWNPGRYIIPEDPKLKSERLMFEYQNGLKDWVRTIRDMYDLATDEDAKKFIDAMEERKLESPNYAGPRKQGGAQSFGLNPLLK